MSPSDPQSDCFKPPAIPTEVFCLHCQQEYESYLIHWAEEVVDGKRFGFWCCPTPGCDGRGFGFDILPTDPEYRDEEGELMWEPVDDCDDDEEDEDDEDDEFGPDDDLFDTDLLQEPDELQDDIRGDIRGDTLGETRIDPDLLRDLPSRFRDDGDIPF